MRFELSENPCDFRDGMLLMYDNERSKYDATQNELIEKMMDIMNGYDMGCPTYYLFDVCNLNIKRISQINPVECHMNIYDMRSLIYADFCAFKLKNGAGFIRVVSDCKKLKLIILNPDSEYLTTKSLTSLVHIIGCKDIEFIDSKSLII